MPTILFSFLLLSFASASANEYCISYTEKNTCEACIKSFEDPNVVCQAPKTQVDNCLVYASDGVCGVCDFGYQLVNNTCTNFSMLGCILQNEKECLFCSRKLILS